MKIHTLRVLTLNCWNVSEPFVARMSLIRAAIAALQPDLIGLQEIVVRRDGFDQGALILDGLGYERAYGAAFRWSDTGAVLPFYADGDAFGNLVASRWPIERRVVRALPGAETGELRTALGVIIKAPFATIPLITTHFHWKFDHGAVRERQAVAVAEFMREWARGTDFPPLLIGDLNAEPDSTEIRFLCGLTSLDGRSTYFQDAWRVAGDGGPGFTWSNRNPYAAMMFEPDRRIDYILVGLADALRNGRGWIERAAVGLSEPTDGVFPSDHFGVFADVRV
jgi:endonuclease/exonuclease/phosphatase family metal-dependent hydrolase